MFEDHPTFKDKLRQQFGVINEESKADPAIQQLKQTQLVADYAMQRIKGRFFKKKPGYRTTPGGIVPSAGNNWHDPDAMQLDNINKGK
ncbi:hypothetical protein A1F95_11220, partial [Pyrenophora tritici-repentis]